MDYSKWSRGVTRCHFPQAINLASVLSPCHHCVLSDAFGINFSETHFCFERMVLKLDFGGRYLIESTKLPKSQVTSLCHSLRTRKQFFSTSGALGDSTFHLWPCTGMRCQISGAIAIQTGSAPPKILGFFHGFHRPSSFLDWNLLCKFALAFFLSVFAI